MRRKITPFHSTVWCVQQSSPFMENTLPDEKEPRDFFNRERCGSWIRTHPNPNVAFLDLHIFERGLDVPARPHLLANIVFPLEVGVDIRCMHIENTETHGTWSSHDNESFLDRRHPTHRREHSTGHGREKAATRRERMYSETRCTATSTRRDHTTPKIFSQSNAMYSEQASIERYV